MSGVATKRARLALYGGAFDPIHNGHLATIAQLLASGECDKVVVVPSGDRPDKKSAVSAADRLMMTERAIAEAFANDSRVVVSDLHAAGKVGYGTIDLVDHFSKQPDTDVFVVLGQELLPDLPSWKEIERLRAIGRFLVIQRPGTPPCAIPQGLKAAPLTFPYQAGVSVSSTTIRDLLARGLSCAGLLPKSVIEFCREKGLYGARG